LVGFGRTFYFREPGGGADRLTPPDAIPRCLQGRFMSPDRAPSIPRIVLALRVAGTLIVLAAFAGWGWRATRWNDELRLVDTFGPAAPIRSFMQRADGLPDPQGGLAVAGGELAVRQYSLTRAPHHRLIVRIDALPVKSARVGAWIIAGGETIPLDSTQFDGRPINLSELAPPGNVDVELWIENTSEAGSPPRRMLRHFIVERRGDEQRTHFPTLLFYGAVGVYFWLVVFAFAIPAAVEQFAEDRPKVATRGRAPPLAALLLLLAAFAALLALPEWRIKKDYDDRAAIGNAAALVDSGFDQSGVYFRSRVRPAFLGIAQPFVAAFPHRLSGHWLNPSDNYRQQWLIYDQQGESFGLFTYPALSFASQGLALLMLLGVYGIYRRLGVTPLLAWLATMLAIAYYGRSLTIAITQTLNLCINVLVVWHYLRGGTEARPLYRITTGVMLGFAFLVKETAATTILTLALFTLMDGPVREVGLRVFRSLPMWAGMTLWPLMYFGGIAEEGFGEILSNFGNHLQQEDLNLFEPLTWSTGLRDMVVVFSAVGLGAVAIGLAVGASGRMRSRADRFMLAWAIGSLPVFLLPYIFPRFLKYFIPSFAYWSVRFLEYLRQKRSGGENA
jgi:hypothetical protein